jgi:ABC-2 type transport system permease protein
LFAASVFFELTWPTARVSQLMEQAQQEFAGTAQMYIKELWNLPIASILISFIVYFIGGYFLYSSLCAIGAAVDNQTDSQQFLTHYYAFSA